MANIQFVPYNLPDNFGTVQAGEGELFVDVVIERETQSREVNFYNLDAIISVGYCVNRHKVTRSRRGQLLRSN